MVFKTAQMIPYVIQMHVYLFVHREEFPDKDYLSKKMTDTKGQIVHAMFSRHHNYNKMDLIIQIGTV